MLSSFDPPRNEVRAFEDRKMLCDLGRRLRKRRREGRDAELAAVAEAFEQKAPRRVAQREEDFIERLGRARCGNAARVLQ